VAINGRETVYSDGKEKDDNIQMKYEHVMVLFNEASVKGIPVQSWTGREVSSRLKLPDFRTKHRPPLLPRKYYWHSFLLDADLTPGS
jgi:hypothetical protein